jgi:Tfp pilus assembly protein PilZ
MEERRQHKRVAVQDMDIHGKMLFANEVRVINICMSGISLKSDRRFEIGREYSLKLEYEDKVLPLNGAVMWSVLSGRGRGLFGENIPIYKAGIKFTTVPTDKLNELIDVVMDVIDSHERDHYELEELHKVSEQGLINTRFHIDPIEKTVLNSPVSYRLRKVSLNGMVIESGHELAIGTRLPMELSLPGNRVISFDGRIAYCLKMQAEGKALHSIGIEFAEMSLTHRERLKEFMLHLDNKNECSSFFVKWNA